MSSVLSTDRLTKAFVFPTQFFVVDELYDELFLLLLQAADLFAHGAQLFLLSAIFLAKHIAHLIRAAGAVPMA